MKVDVGNCVRSSPEGIREAAGPSRASSGPGARDSKLNYPKKSEVDVLSDDLSKAKLVLWRDNLDLHLEEFPDFGPGIDGVLRKVRLQHSLVKPKDISEFMRQVKEEGALTGSRGLLMSFDMHKVSRDLYKFFHRQLTVKLKASAVMACAPGMGFELYRTISKKLDPNNDMSRHMLFLMFDGLPL